LTHNCKPRLYSGINMTNQVQVQSITGDVMSAFLALSPPPLSNDNGRTHELEAILSVINNANRYFSFLVLLGPSYQLLNNIKFCSILRYGLLPCFILPQKQAILASCR